MLMSAIAGAKSGAMAGVTSARRRYLFSYALIHCCYYVISDARYAAAAIRDAYYRQY